MAQNSPLQSRSSVNAPLQSGDLTRKRRLENNRESVRRCRAKKKIDYEHLQEEMNVLREESSQLRLKNAELHSKNAELHTHNKMLERELHAQNMCRLLVHFGEVPVFGTT